MPIDAIPDIAPGIGFMDDAVVTTTARSVLGSQINETHRQKARDLIDRL